MKSMALIMFFYIAGLLIGAGIHSAIVAFLIGLPIGVVLYFAPGLIVRWELGEDKKS
jgi:hypothetical protein